MTTELITAHGTPSGSCRRTNNAAAPIHEETELRYMRSLPCWHESVRHALYMRRGPKTKTEPARARPRGRSLPACIARAYIDKPRAAALTVHVSPRTRRFSQKETIGFLPMVISLHAD